MIRAGVAPRFLMVFMLLIAGAALGDDEKPATPAKPPLPWTTELPKGRAEALRLRRPILVRIGAEWCPWCRKLEQEIARPEVQDALAGWTLVALDADKSAQEVQSLGAGPIPALRALTPLGRVVAAHEGFLPAADLVTWLGTAREQAGEAPPEELTETGAPSAVGVVRLLRQLDQSDALLREAALRRLRGCPAEAAGPVVEAFAEGSLQRRLAALDLLAAWHAPVAGLDPWRPQTVTETRLRALRIWSEGAAAAAAPDMPALTAPRQADASREIDRMLAADPAGAAALRERLAGLGRALLPVVYERLKHAESDEARERLTALRYRLVAAAGLGLKWPGGFERLAATDVAVRHRAVDELAQLATAEDEPLWLELFSDPDPLIRETALRALGALGAAGTSQALVGLLADPAPNVRAAVLKQLAEHPSPRLAEPLGEYVARETDPDLVVHAVRALREIKNAQSLKVLNGLLKHASWSVRAEAVEGIGKRLERGGQGEAYDNAVEALLGALKDADGFVAGRAVVALKEVDRIGAVEPILQVAETRPELAAKAIEVASQPGGWKQEMPKKARPLIRKFARHARPDVRAAVVKALGGDGEEGAAPEVLAALDDPESSVREEAANALFAKLEALRIQGNNAGAGLSERQDDEPADAADAWLTRFQKREKNWPSWADAAIGPLTARLKDDAPDARVAAALPLVALGRGANARRTLAAAARERPALVGRASDALPWQHWPDRLELFEQLLAAQPGVDQLGALAGNLAEVPDPRASGQLWKLAARDDLDAQAAVWLVDALRKIFFGNQMYNTGNLTKPQRQRVAKEVRPRTGSGSEWQRLIALVLLLGAAPDEAAQAARALADDPAAPPALRRDAFQVLLVAGDQDDSRKAALAALGEPGSDRRMLALRFLTHDTASLGRLRDWIMLYTDSPAYAVFVQGESDGDTSLPKLPSALKPEMLRPLLEDGDPEIAALAGYALTLLGDASGLPVVLKFWRGRSSTGGPWERRTYQAIGQVGDDSHVTVLEQIYTRARAELAAAQYGGDEVKDLYWTIRGMDGPNAQKLRKRIRAEVGMPYLRGEAGAEAIP